MTDPSTPPATPDRERIDALLGRMRPQSLFMMQRDFVRPDLIEGVLLRHLEWLISLEKEGVLLMSGPLRDGSGAMCGGVSVFRCADLAAARALACADPLIVAGAATCTVAHWQVNEGRLTVSVDLSDGALRFG